MLSKPVKGRGAVSNADGRYESTQHEQADDDWLHEDEQPVKTHLRVDHTKSIITTNQSPDVPFEQSINPYRGCEHGCIYCYARPTHAWLGHSPGLDFESQIYYKPDAAKLLRKQLAKKSYRCQAIALGANTDAYQPAERKLGITRDIVEVLKDLHHPVTIITKSSLVERDIDLLSEMANQNLAQVIISLTTLDKTIARTMEPRTASPGRRLKSIETLSSAGIPVGVLIAPVIPFLTDHEIETMLEPVANAGAKTAAYIMLRLPLELKTLFEEWLHAHYPMKARHVLNRLRDLHEGELYQTGWGKRQTGTGAYAKIISQRFNKACEKHHLNQETILLDTHSFSSHRNDQPQLDLFH